MADPIDNVTRYLRERWIARLNAAPEVQALSLTFEDYRPYLERFWWPHRLVMTQLKTGRSTVLEVSEYRFRAGLAAP